MVVVAPIGKKTYHYKQSPKHRSEYILAGNIRGPRHIVSSILVISFAVPNPLPFLHATFLVLVPSELIISPKYLVNNVLKSHRLGGGSLLDRY